MQWSRGGRKSKSGFANPVFNNVICQIVFGFGLYLRLQNQITSSGFGFGLYLHEKFISVFGFGFYLRIMVVFGFGFGFASRGFVNTSAVE